MLTDLLFYTSDFFYFCNPEGSIGSQVTYVLIDRHFAIHVKWSFQ